MSPAISNTRTDDDSTDPEVEDKVVVGTRLSRTASDSLCQHSEPAVADGVSVPEESSGHGPYTERHGPADSQSLFGAAHEEGIDRRVPVPECCGLSRIEMSSTTPTTTGASEGPGRRSPHPLTPESP